MKIKPYSLQKVKVKYYDVVCCKFLFGTFKVNFNENCMPFSMLCCHLTLYCVYYVVLSDK